MERKVTGRKKTGKKKATPARRKPRRRISGANDFGGMAQKAGGLVLGAVAARELNTLLSKFFPSLATSPMISGALQMGVGFVLPKFIKGAFFQNLGDGMIANGGMVLIVSTGVISGVNSMTYRINGTPYLQTVNGTSRLNTVNGTNRIGNEPPNVKRRWANNG